MRKRHLTTTHVIKSFILVVLVISILFSGWYGWIIYSSVSKITGNKNPIQLLSAFTPTKLNETNGRTNILLAGNSVDDPGHNGAALTDSIMVVSVDQSSKSAVLISIPRDLWVDIPGFGYQKINAAYEDGQSESFSQSGYPSGGMGLLEEVIQQNLDINFNYYMLVDYTALRDAVNAVGGIDITIQSQDARGIYDPSIDYSTGGPLVDLTNGIHHLDGQEALDLARARGDSYGSYGFPNADFTRTAYQQSILIAIKNKASSAEVIANPLRAGQLITSLGNNITTDLKTNEMETLYSVMKNSSTSQIKTITLNNLNGQDLLTSYITPDYENALVPTLGIGNFSYLNSMLSKALS